MAETKKRGTTKSTAKAADTKTVEAKTTPAEPVAEAEPVTEVKKTTRKTAAKKTTIRKTPAKTEAAEKKTRGPRAKKETAAKEEAVNETVYLQFAGKSYTTQDLVNIAKDVWKYDLGREAEDFKTVELYVKPEENKVYYVINGDVKDSFNI